MNEIIIKEISKDLNITEKQVNTVLELLNDGNTIPFIARYRKEATGALSEEAIKQIGDVYLYQYNETEDGEPDLGNIEDDEEYEIAADAFDEWMDSQEFDESDIEE